MRTSIKTKLLTAVLAAAGLGMSLPGPARAQEVSEVVVTGSHIRRAAADSPAPVTSLSGDEIRASGILSLGDALLNTPMAAANVNQQSAAVTSFLSGQVRADIRGLGASRTLVLMDGRRMVFSDASSPAVDMNMFPTLMVERVDVVAGGASAVYGSEAVAGVVNVIMRKSVKGLETDFQAGVSQEGDGEEYRAGAVYGHKFMDDRLNIVVGGEFTHSGLIMQRDRDSLYPGLRRNSVVLPQTAIPNSKTNQSPYATFQLRPTVAVALDATNPGQLTALSPACATATVAPSCQDPALIYNTYFTPLQGRTGRGVVRGYGEYQLADHVQMFGEASYARVTGYAPNTPAFSTAAGAAPMPIFITLDNGFLNGPGALAAQLRAAIAAAGVPAGSKINVAKYFGEFGGRDSRTERNTTRLVGGMQGDIDALARNVHWDWYAQYGKVDGTVVSPGQPNVPRLQQAVDAVIVNGQVVCRSAAAQAAGCQPFDLINGASPAAAAWANGVATAKTSIKQTVVAANLATDLFDLPAGPVGLAAGLEYRKEESRFSQDPITASGALFFSATGTRAGQYDVTEGYAELRVPVLKDQPFAEELSFEVAGRAANYSTIGKADQHRLAVIWAPIRDIEFRASQGAAVRAPNIVELYAPQTPSFTTTAADPCDKASFAAATAAQQAARRITCAAAISGYNPATFTSNIGLGRNTLLRVGGNPNLGPETSHTYQLGVVVQPRFVPDLRLSLDYFRYRIRDGVGSVPLNTQLQQLCYDSTVALASNPFCSVIVRDTTGTATGVVGGISEVDVVAQNVASTKVEGYDASAAYRLSTPGFGDFALRADATWMYRFALQGLPGQAYTQLANSVANATPEWKATGTIDWRMGAWSAGWTTHFVGSMILSSSFTPAQLSPFTTGDYYTHDLRVGYRLNDGVALRAGVINLTDKYPPSLPETYNGTQSNGASIFDNRGRYFYVGAKLTY